MFSRSLFQKRNIQMQIKQVHSKTMNDKAIIISSGPKQMDLEILALFTEV